MKKRSNRQSLDVWNTVPWLVTHRTDGPRSYMIDGAEEAQRLTAHAWVEERAPSVPPADADEPNDGKT